MKGMTMSFKDLSTQKTPTPAKSAEKPAAAAPAATPAEKAPAAKG